jgi:hypothetical protein
MEDFRIATNITLLIATVFGFVMTVYFMVKKPPIRMLSLGPCIWLLSNALFYFYVVLFLSGPFHGEWIVVWFNINKLWGVLLVVFGSHFLLEGYMKRNYGNPK